MVARLKDMVPHASYGIMHLNNVYMCKKNKHISIIYIKINNRHNCLQKDIEVINNKVRQYFINPTRGIGFALGPVHLKVNLMTEPRTGSQDAGRSEWQLGSLAHSSLTSSTDRSHNLLSILSPLQRLLVSLPNPVGSGAAQQHMFRDPPAKYISLITHHGRMGGINNTCT